MRIEGGDFGTLEFDEKSQVHAERVVVVIAADNSIIFSRGSRGNMDRINLETSGQRGFVATSTSPAGRPRNSH